MSVKLFVTDLDGTLLPSGKDVPRENIEAVQKAVRAGIIVTIATGRMYCLWRRRSASMCRSSPTTARS